MVEGLTLVSWQQQPIRPHGRRTEGCCNQGQLSGNWGYCVLGLSRCILPVWCFIAETFTFTIRWIITRLFHYSAAAFEYKCSCALSATV